MHVLRLSLLSLALTALLGGCSDSPPEAIEVPKAAAPAAAPPPAPAREVKQYDIDTLLSNLRLIGADMSPDGSKVQPRRTSPV